MEEYAKAGAAREKADGSPVTAADERAEAIIVARLQALAPDIAVVAEEATAAGADLVAPPRFFLVDPLDGTREFIARNGEFTINIGLIENGAPIAGAVSTRRRIDRHLVRRRDAPSRRSVAVGATLPAGRCESAAGAPGAGCADARWRAARTPIPRPTRFWPGSASTSASRPAPRSSSASSPKAAPTSIRASRRRWNGTRRRATRCCARRAAASSRSTARRCATASSRRGVAQRRLRRLGRPALWRRASLTLCKPFASKFRLASGQLRRVASRYVRVAAEIRDGAGGANDGAVTRREWIAAAAGAAATPAAAKREAPERVHASTRSSIAATSSSAPCRAASPRRCRRRAGAGACPTATSWARRPPPPSSAACATARARCTPATPATAKSTGRARRSASTPAPTATAR